MKQVARVATMRERGGSSSGCCRGRWRSGLLLLHAWLCVCVCICVGSAKPALCRSSSGGRAAVESRPWQNSVVKNNGRFGSSPGPVQRGWPVHVEHGRGSGAYYADLVLFFCAAITAMLLFIYYTAPAQLRAQISAFYAPAASVSSAAATASVAGYGHRRSSRSSLIVWRSKHGSVQAEMELVKATGGGGAAPTTGGAAGEPEAGGRRKSKNKSRSPGRGAGEGKEAGGGGNAGAGRKAAGKKGSERQKQSKAGAATGSNGGSVKQPKEALRKGRRGILETCPEEQVEVEQGSGRSVEISEGKEKSGGGREESPWPAWSPWGRKGEACWSAVPASAGPFLGQPLWIDCHYSDMWKLQAEPSCWQELADDIHILLANSAFGHLSSPRASRSSSGSNNAKAARLGVIGQRLSSSTIAGTAESRIPPPVTNHISSSFWSADYFSTVF